MIQQFVDTFMEKQEELRARFAETHPASYTDLVHEVMKILHDEGRRYDTPDPDRIHVIDDGDYQGTLVFIIGANGYQPDIYWSVMVNYGSCSGCDTLQAIHDEMWPNSEQVNAYMTLALHIVQRLKEL